MVQPVLLFGSEIWMVIGRMEGYMDNKHGGVEGIIASWIPSRYWRTGNYRYLKNINNLSHK